MIALTKRIGNARASLATQLSCAAILIFASIPATQAQGVGASRGLSGGDGINTIQGRVFFPAGQTGKILKVTLETTSSMGGGSTVTDLDGTFRFNNLRPGGYTVVVEGGKEFESARETVNIDPSGGRIAQVSVQMRPKVDASNPAFAGVPQNALDFYQKGTAAAKKGNSKSAAEFLSKAVTASPNFAAALSDLGVQYLMLGQMDKAAETFEALLKLKPNEALPHLDLGIALYNQSQQLLTDKKVDESSQKATQAETHLREAIKLNSPGPNAHYYLGLTLIKPLRRYDEAQAELEAAVKNGGENIALAHRYLGGLYMNSHRNKEAADELEKYLQLDPKSPSAEQIRGTIKDLRTKQ